jgi:hypothetical protein
MSAMEAALGGLNRLNKAGEALGWLNPNAISILFYSIPSPTRPGSLRVVHYMTLKWTTCSTCVGRVRVAENSVRWSSSVGAWS